MPNIILSGAAASCLDLQGAESTTLSVTKQGCLNYMAGHNTWSLIDTNREAAGAPSQWGQLLAFFCQCSRQSLTSCFDQLLHPACSNVMRFSVGPQQQQPQSQVHHTRTAHGGPPFLLLLGQVPVLPRLGLGQRQDAPLQQGGPLGQSGLQLDGCQPQLVAVLRMTEAGLGYVGGITGVALGAGVAAVQGEVEQPEAGEAAVRLQAFGDALQAAHQLLTCRHMQHWLA